ncbi:MAG: hypothetical protein SFV23_01190 [Planctomycetaceae bacterium]|nr:hypothetical protein [Planctomycetaceae bacterium]
MKASREPVTPALTGPLMKSTLRSQQAGSHGHPVADVGDAVRRAGAEILPGLARLRIAVV